MLGLDINGLFYLKPDYSAASPQHESYIYPIHLQHNTPIHSTHWARGGDVLRKSVNNYDMSSLIVASMWATYHPPINKDILVPISVQKPCLKASFHS